MQAAVSDPPRRARLAVAFEVSAGFVVGAVGSAWLVVVAAVLLHHDHGEV